MKRKKRRDAGRPRGASVVDSVLAHTLAELATSGLEGLSIDRIAQRAQVNKTSVYRRWPTREKLVGAALEATLGQMAAQLPDTGSLRGDLIGLLTPVAGLFEQPAGRALVQAALAETSAPAILLLSAKSLSAPGNAMRQLVARARARGEWSEGVNPQQLSFMLVGAVLHRSLIEHQPVKKAWLAALIDLSLQGVLPRKRTTAAH